MINNPLQLFPRNQRGITLVELVIVASLLSVVLGIGYSVYFFGTDSFARGEKRSDVRQNVRLGADFITQELRYATHVRVLLSVPLSSEFQTGGDLHGYKCIYVDDGFFKYVNDGGDEETPFSSIAGSITLDPLNFKMDGMFLEYEIKNNNGVGDDYTISSKLKFLNSPLTEPVDPTDPLLNLTGLAIAYKSNPPIPIPPLALVIGEDALPNATLGEPYSHTFTATGGIEPYIFTIAAESLPAGLTLLTNGELIGTPTESGIFLFTVVVTDMKGSVDQHAGFSLVVESVAVVPDFVTFVIEENVFVYGTQFNFQGNTVIGPNATMVINGGLVTSDLNGNAQIGASFIYIDGNVFLNGGSASLGSQTNPGQIHINGDLYLGSGTRHIYGDVYVAGNLYLKDARIHGRLYVDGDVQLDWTPWLADSARIYYTGSLSWPAGNYSPSILSKCIHQGTVPSAEVLNLEIPPMKPDSWYTDRGYRIDNPPLANNIKILSNNYTGSNNAQNVIVISKGDINITGWRTLTGVLYAPYGKVTFQSGHFQGLVIARDGFFCPGGGGSVTFKNIDNYISNPDDYPF